MDWDHAIKRNSEVLAGIVESLFVMLGLVGEATVSRISWPAYRAVLRVFRPAESALRRLIVVAARGLVIAPTVSRPKTAGAIKPRKRGISRPSFQLFDPQPRIVLPRRRRTPRAVPRIHFFNTDGEFITIGPPIRPAKAPPGPNPLMAWSMRRESSAGSRPWRQRFKTFPARPSAWCAGGCGRKSQKTQVSKRRSAPAARRAPAGGPFTSSMSCSTNASGSPIAPRCPTRAEM